MLTIIYYEMLNILVYLISLYSLYFADTICIPTKSIDSSRISVINEKKIILHISVEAGYRMLTRILHTVLHYIWTELCQVLPYKHVSIWRM